MSKKNVVKPDAALKELAKLFKQRNDEYGDTYHQHGTVIMALFPNGVPSQISDIDANRFGILTMMVSKLCRYVQNYECGGHEDSLNDLSVYSQMLAEIDRESHC